jgi:phosphoserine phosphatase RsbU/P
LRDTVFAGTLDEADLKMQKESTEHGAPAYPFGTTMRIDIAPEILEQAKRHNLTPGIRRPQRMIAFSRERSAVPPLGGIDFQQLLQNIYDAALITQLSGEIVMANVRANQFFSAEPEQLSQYNILGLIFDAGDSLLPTILETLRENRFVLMQAYCTRMDGSFFPAEISVNRLRLDGRDYLSFFVRDVTLRKEQEERLSTGYAALQNSSSGIAIADLNTKIEYCNPAFLSFLGISDAEQLEGRTVREFLCEPARADEVIEAIAASNTWGGELEMRRVDGSTFFSHASVRANLNTGGQRVGMVLSVLDITPQKHAQQQLEAYASELNQQNMQMQEDLNVASELHRAFLPRDFQVFPDGASPEQVLLQFRHLYCPTGTIGGDFFDIRKLSDHKVALFISDVMGHGIRSALVVATIRGLIEQVRPFAEDPGALMTQLNATYTAIFKQMGGSVTFATAFYGVVDTRDGVLRYTNASHPPPYILRRDTSQLQRLYNRSHERSAALGLFGDVCYATEEFQLTRGDLLLLYTDGLSEVENAELELYETRRFEDALHANFNRPAGELLNALLKNAEAFADSTAFEDDVCLLAMEVPRLQTEAGV